MWGRCALASGFLATRRGRRWFRGGGDGGGGRASHKVAKRTHRTESVQDTGVTNGFREFGEHLDRPWEEAPNVSNGRLTDRGRGRPLQRRGGGRTLRGGGNRGTSDRNSSGLPVTSGRQNPMNPASSTRDDRPVMRPSRRQFGRTVAGAAASMFAAPAFVRGRNLNEKLNIAMIACGGRGAHNLGAGRLREHRRALRRVRAGRRPGRARATRRPARSATSGSSTTITPTSSTRWSSAPPSTPTPSPPCRPCNWASTSTARSR